MMWLIARYQYEAIRLLKHLDKPQRALVLGLIGAMSAIFIHGLVDVPYFKNDLAVLFWLGLALTGWLNWQLRGKLKSKKANSHETAIN